MREASEGDRRTVGETIKPLDVENHDNSGTIRLKKYASGAHLIPGAALPEVGCTPREVAWTKNKARLYRYEPEKEKKYTVPVLFVYALILRPYILDLCRATA